MMLPASKSTVLRPSEVRRILLEGDNYFPGTVSLYRREAIRALGGFQESFGSFADSVVARQLALTYGFYFLADILGYWRIHDQSYSMISLSDPQALSAKIADIQAMIVRSDLFPPGYDALFDRRTRFGAARIALAADAPVATKAASIAELLNAKDGERRLLQILLRLGQFGRLAALAWITLQTRPMSISKLLGQFSARRAIIAATPAYRTP